MSTVPDFDRVPDLGAHYPGMTTRSVYIPMRDGVRLAADIYLPAGLPAGERIPAMLYQTRYWRSFRLRAPFRWLLPGEGDRVPLTRRIKEFYVTRGFAQVVVDVRGTGASFGVCRHSWEAVSVRDSTDILDWIVAQPWSNGRVAGLGVSYLGTTAELLLATRHPALKAVVPQFNHPDPYTDIAVPGGLFNRRFIGAWTGLNESLDRNQNPAMFGLITRITSSGVSPVGGRQGAALLLEALSDHRQNGGTADLDINLQFRDDLHPEKGYSMDDQTVMRFREEIMESKVPVYGWASWMDAGTANAAGRRFRTFPGPQLAVIGAWNHGGAHQSSPYQPSKTPLSPPPELQRQEILRFLDACLNTHGEQPELESTIHYFTLGAEIWQKSPTWPPPGTRMRRWYFAPGQMLSHDLPQPSSDRYEVDFRASTGRYNRWWELGVVERRPVDYGDRAAQKPYLLGYESAPLEDDLEIAGTPVISLRVASSEPDCAFIAYLEDVFPDGRVVYLTEGQLRSIHRKVASVQKSPYRLQAPYHTFRREDVLPLIPGEAAEITFGLLPVSALIRRGHRIRVSLAGHDDGTFPRTPAIGQPVWTVLLGGETASWIDLPVCPG